MTHARAFTSQCKGFNLLEFLLQLQLPSPFIIKAIELLSSNCNKRKIVQAQVLETRCRLNALF